MYVFDQWVNEQAWLLQIWPLEVLTVDGQACLSNLRESAPANGTARWFRSLAGASTTSLSRSTCGKQGAAHRDQRSRCITQLPSNPLVPITLSLPS
jgi:hypothetical protein